LIETFVGLSLFTIRLSFLPDGNSYAHACINYEKGLLIPVFALITDETKAMKPDIFMNDDE